MAQLVRILVISTSSIKCLGLVVMGTNRPNAEMKGSWDSYFTGIHRGCPCLLVGVLLVGEETMQGGQTGVWLTTVWLGIQRLANYANCLLGAFDVRLWYLN